MIRVVKIYLYCDVLDKNGNPVDYKTVNGILWKLQQETRLIKNKAVQLCWEWFNFQSDYKDKYGKYPVDKDILDRTLFGHIYIVVLHLTVILIQIILPNQLMRYVNSSNVMLKIIEKARNLSENINKISQ